MFSNIGAMNDKINIECLVEKIAKVEPIAVTASKSSIRNCIIVLTIYDTDRDIVSDEVLQTSEVSIGGTTAQLMIEFSHDGLNTMDDILLYSSDDITAEDTAIQMDVGFNSLYDEFEYYADERAEEELDMIFENYCENVDTPLLLSLVNETEPARMFFSPSSDTVVGIYYAYGNPYYLYEAGSGGYGAYRGTDYATEMLRDARYWNGTGEPISKSSVPA